MTEQPDQRNALVIVAHPDDAEFGSAGTVAKWAQEGWNVTYVICTDASAGGGDEATDVGPDARKRLSETRKREQREAAKILGVKDVIFLDYPDGRLQPTIELRRDLVRIIRQVKPQRVIVPSPDRTWTPAYSTGRYHPDHLAVGEASLAALYPAAQNPWDFPELLEEGIPPYHVAEIYVVGAPAANHTEDISSTIDRKVAALRAHESQLAAHFDELEPMIRKWAEETGKEQGYAAAESFHKADHR